MMMVATDVLQLLRFIMAVKDSSVAMVADTNLFMLVVVVVDINLLQVVKD